MQRAHRRDPAVKRGPPPRGGSPPPHPPTHCRYDAISGTPNDRGSRRINSDQFESLFVSLDALDTTLTCSGPAPESAVTGSSHAETALAIIMPITPTIFRIRIFMGVSPVL